MQDGFALLPGVLAELREGNLEKLHGQIPGLEPEAMLEQAPTLG